MNDNSNNTKEGERHIGRDGEKAKKNKNNNNNNTKAPQCPLAPKLWNIQDKNNDKIKWNKGLRIEKKGKRQGDIGLERCWVATTKM